VVVTGKTVNGLRTLIDGDPAKKESGDHFPTGKVTMSAGVAENAWLLVLHDKLGLAVDWLQQFISVQSCAETVVEVQTSNKFPGLPTWYVVDEVNVRVHDKADQGELKLLGLPLGIQFRGTGKHRQRLWLWTESDNPDEMPMQASTGKRMTKANTEPVSGSNRLRPSRIIQTPRSTGSPEHSQSPERGIGTDDVKLCPSLGRQASDASASTDTNSIGVRGRSAIRTQATDSLATVPVAAEAQEPAAAEEESANSKEAAPTKRARGRSGIRTRDLDAAPEKATTADQPATSQANVAEAADDDPEAKEASKPKARGRSAVRNGTQQSIVDI
jgi:hypothetical protein